MFDYRLEAYCECARSSVHQVYTLHNLYAIEWWCIAYPLSWIVEPDEVQNAYKKLLNVKQETEPFSVRCHANSTKMHI